MASALDCVCAEAEEAVRSKEYNIIILSDRAVGPDRIPIPSLLATSAVHHHLIKQGLRTSVGLVVETGEANEVHQFCTLAGYGAEAINPYLAFETLEQMLPELDEEMTAEEVKKRYIKAIGKAILKVMAKMGISTYQSYCGAQIFDAVGLRSSFVRKYFTGTHTQIEGVGLREIAQETVDRHAAAFGNVPVLENALDVGGEYAYRVRGEAHVWRAGVVADLQHAVRGNTAATSTASFAKQINDQSEQLMTMRGMFRIRSAEALGRKPGADRGGRAGGRYREALRDRRHELRLDLARGAHDARHRHEPHRRQVEHRRGRRGDAIASSRCRTATPCARRSSRSPRAASA